MSAEDLELIQHGLANISNQLDEMQEGQVASSVPVEVKVAMRCLDILSASQKYNTITKLDRKAAGSGFSEGGSEELISESIHRYPRPLEESEQGLRDVCCQFLSGYLINAIGGGDADGVDELSP